MVDQVEKVARAIHIARFDTPGGREVDEMGPADHEYCGRLARAAITAYNPNERLMPSEASLERAWVWFLDANPDDVTSPEEYPDHALVTFKQMVGILKEAALTDAEERGETAVPNPNERLSPANHEPLGGDDLVIRLMYALHAHVPEDQRPLSMSDLSDEQAARARAAVHAVLTEWESAKAALHPDPSERLREALEGGTISQTSFDGHTVRIDFETRAEANELFAALARTSPSGLRE